MAGFATHEAGNGGAWRAAGRLGAL